MRPNSAAPMCRAALQYTASHYNTLHRTTTHCVQCAAPTPSRRPQTLAKSAAPMCSCNTLHTLECTTTPSSCNILQHTPDARWRLPVQPNQNIRHLSYICDMPYSDFICICDKESFAIILPEHVSFVIYMWHAILRWVIPPSHVTYIWTYICHIYVTCEGGMTHQMTNDSFVYETLSYLLYDEPFFQPSV